MRMTGGCMAGLTARRASLPAQEVLNHLCRIVCPMTALKNQLITEEGKVGTGARRLSSTQLQLSV